LAIEAPDILEIEQVCDFAGTRVAQLQGLEHNYDASNDEPLSAWETNCLLKVQAWLKSLKSADQMDRVTLAVQTLREEGVLFWVDDEHPSAEVAAMITISSQHITKDASEWLEVSGNSLVRFDKADYGWFIPLGHLIHGEGDLPEGTPKSLIDAIEWAAGKGAEWLCIDRDGPTVDALTTFDW
jgi:hypothetical protein